MPTDQQDTAKQEMDVHGYLKESFGASILNANDDGSHTISIDGEEQTVNVKGLVAEQLEKSGVDPNSMILNFSTPENPMQSNALDFSTQMGLSVASSAKDKIRLLREEYGTSNVRFNAKDKSFTVRDADGNWKGAESGFLSGLLANEGLAIAGGIKGSIAGSFAGPVGMVVGGAIGGAVGKLASLSMAESSGIRTDLEAADVMKEMGKEFIIGMAGGSVVPVGKLALGAVGKAMSVIGRKTANSEVAQAGVAKLLAQTTGAAVEDTGRYVAKPEFFNKIHKEMATHDELLQAVRNQKPGAPRVEPTLGVKTRMAKDIDNLMQRGRDKMSSDFDHFINRGDVKQTLRTKKIDANAWADGFKQEMVENGIIDSSGRILTTNNAQRGLVRRVFAEIDKVGGQQKMANLRLEDANRLKQSLHNMVKFSGNKLEVGDAFQGLIKRNSGRLREQVTNAIPDPKMRDEWVKVHQNWGQAKDFFDTHKRLFKPGQVETRLSSFLGASPTGQSIRQTLNDTFSGVLELPGADRTIQNLMDSQSAINTFSLFKKGSTGVPQVAGIGGAATLGGLVGGPAGAALGAGIGIAATSPRLAPAIAAKVFKNRLTQGTLNAMRTMGKVGNWVHSLSQSQRAALLTTQGMQTIDNLFENAARDEAVIGEQLRGQIQGR